MKIAEGLLLRKQLEQKVAQLQPIYLNGKQGLFETKIERIDKGENVDEVKIQVPKVSLNEVTKLYDHYASELRKLDASIQQANWSHDLTYKEKSAPEQKEVK